MRENLMNKLDELYSELCELGWEDKAEEILYNNNASDDDSDPDEGFMVTMTDADLSSAIKDMRHAISSVNPQDVQSIIYGIQSGTFDSSPEYGEGFLDACKMIVDEYGISLSI